MPSAPPARNAAPARTLPWAIALVAGAALAYQLLLMRLLSIVHWYPFAAMIVSLALLGHGASGTALALAGERVRARFAPVFVACAAGFALAAPLAFAAAQALPFNGLALVWDWRQFGWLGAIYLLLALPFGLAATCFGASFAAYGERIPRLYAADLVGAGLGAVALVAGCQVLPLAWCLRAIAVAGLAGAALLCASRRGAVALLIAGLAAVAALPHAWLTPQPNEFKGLARALRVPGARVIETRSGPLGLVQVLDSPTIPLRHAPGLSLAATREPAPQLGLFIDGDGPSVITRWNRGADAVDAVVGAASAAMLFGDAVAAEAAPTRTLAYLGQTTSALPYALLVSPRVLVLGAGGGADVLQAVLLGAESVVAVERDPNVVALVRDTFGEYSGGLYADPRVRVVVADARRALRVETGPFDLIVWPLSDSASGAGAGALAAGDQFGYTVEAMRMAFGRLAPGGLLAATRWDSQPPRDNLKLFATLVAALRAEGVADPALQLAMIRGWQTSTLMLKRGPFSAAETTRLHEFCARLSFDPVYWPGLDPAETNRFNVVDDDLLASGTRTLLGADRDAFIARYAFDLVPATDDRPFFHNLFRWRSLPELLRLREAGAAALLDSGYLLVAAALAQALPLALVLILLPLFVLRRAAHGPVRRARAVAYFGCLGLAFLLVEIAAISRATRVIGDSMLGATVVLAALLVFASLGSALASRWIGRPRAIPVAAGAIVLALAVFELALAPLAGLAGDSLPARAGVTATLLAPLAIAMGVPFPLALARLAQTAPAFVPWAWGINGCASVASALLALLLAIAFGYAVVMAAAAALYLLAGWLWRSEAL